MSRHDDTVSLRQMLEYAQEALDMIEGRVRADLDADRMLNLAMTRLIEIVGEAAGRVTPETRQRHEEIPWAEIVGLRNRLIHGYDAVDLDILWQVIQADLPPLISQLEAILGDAGLETPI